MPANPKQTLPRRCQIEALEGRRLLALFANGIDSDNLGEGVWAWGLRSAMSNLGYGSNYANFFNYVHNTQGCQYIIIKAADGGSVYNNPAGSQSYTTTVRNAAHAAGLKIFPYFYIRGTDDATVTAEVNVFNSIVSSVGADGVVFDIEGDWAGGVGGATSNTRIVNYFNGIGKSQAGDGTGSRDSMFMAYSSFPYVSLHGEDPFLKLGDYCDASMPQPYWATLGNSPTSSSCRSPTKGQSLRGVGGPSRMVKDVDSEYRMMSLESTPRANIWNGHPESIKPVIMTGQMYSNATAAEIAEFYDAVKNDTTAVGSGNVAGYKYKSINFFDEDTAGVTTAAQRDALNTLFIGDLPGMPSSPTPANNANLSSSPASLDWADILNTYGSPSTGAATSYDVYIDGVKKTTIDALTGGSSYTVSPALIAGSHTWQIIANDIIGSTSGPTWNFTITPPLLNPPSNFTATDGLFQDHVALSWGAVSGASKYQLYRNTTNDPATASALGQPTGTTFDDFTANANTTYYYWAATFNSNNAVGNKGAADTGFADTVGPTVTARSYQSQFDPPYVSFTFSELVSSSISLGSVSFSNLDIPGGAVPTASSFSYIGASNTAKFFLTKPLPDGNFRATISGVTDTAGNSFSTTNSTLDFYFLSGDANADRVVNALDFNMLASHFGFAGAGFAGGDFDFSGTVNSADFTLLASHWLASTPPPISPPGAPLGSLFADTHIKPVEASDTNAASIESLL